MICDILKRMMSLKNSLEKMHGYNSLVLPYHWMKAIVMGVKYGFPGRKMTVIGVTGTNGKTTTSFMIWKMLNEAGYKTGIMTTVGWGVEKIESQVEHMTTVAVETLNQRMKKISEQGAEFLVLEVTSHALAQFRTLGVPIEVAVMTNVTHEHLDYHKTFEKYCLAKRKLFKKAKFGVVNADDRSGIWFMQDVPEYLTYGIKHGKLKAKEVKLGVRGVEYSCGEIKIKRAERAVGARDDVEYQVGKIEVKTQIPGEFNVYNSLAAVAVGLRLGLNEEEISRGLNALMEVEGRMHRVQLGQDYEVIVDYAHTPDAFMKIYNSVVPGVKKRYATTKDEQDREVRRKARIISLFGGAGRRDESTREERGEIGGKYSDVVIVTEDDSRDENPSKIAEQFMQGAEKAGKVRGKNLWLELSRARAIRKACELAEPGDLVLILGKGHEKTILRADGPHPFEDIRVTEKVIKTLMQAKN